MSNAFENLESIPTYCAIGILWSLLDLKEAFPDCNWVPPLQIWKLLISEVIEVMTGRVWHSVTKWQKQKPAYTPWGSAHLLPFSRFSEISVNNLSCYLLEWQFIGKAQFSWYIECLMTLFSILLSFMNFHSITHTHTQMFLCSLGMIAFMCNFYITRR